MNQKRTLRDRSLLLKKSNISSTKNSFVKNKFSEKENYLLHSEIKKDADHVSDKMIVKSLRHNQYKNRPKRTVIKQSSTRKEKIFQVKENNSFNETVDHIEHSKKNEHLTSNSYNQKHNIAGRNAVKYCQQSIKNDKNNTVLSSVENICSEKVLNTKKKCSKPVSNSEKVPIWKKNLNILKPCKKRPHVDVYDITLDEDLTSNKEQTKKKKSHVAENKIKENVIQKKYANKHLKSQKTRLSKSESVNKNKALQIDQVSIKKVVSVETGKSVLPHILSPILNKCDNEACIELNSFFISSPNDTIENVQSTQRNLQSCKSNDEVNQESLDKKTLLHIDQVSAKRKASTETGKSILPHILSPSHSEYDSELCIEQNSFFISSPNDTIESIQCAHTNLQSCNSLEKRKMYLSNLADELEKSFSIPKMTSTPDSSLPKAGVQSQNNEIISISHISSIPANNTNFTVTSTPSDIHSKTQMMAQKHKDINITNTSSTSAMNKNCLNTEDAISIPPDNDFPQTDKIIAEITLFESPKKSKPKEKNIEHMSPQKTIQINLFGEVLRTPSSVESLEDSYIMSKKAYHTPDNFKAHLIRTKKPHGKTKKELKKSKDDLLIEKMSQHFDEIENTDLCIE